MLADAVCARVVAAGAAIAGVRKTDNAKKSSTPGQDCLTTAHEANVYSCSNLSCRAAFCARCSLRVIPVVFPVLACTLMTEFQQKRVGVSPRPCISSSSVLAITGLRPCHTRESKRDELINNTKKTRCQGRTHRRHSRQNTCTGRSQMHGTRAVLDSAPSVNNGREQD